MKIVQINAVYQFSSIGRTTMEMHQYLTKKGHQSYVFCTNHEDKNNQIYEVGNRFTHKIHALLSRLTGLQAYFSHYSTSKLIHQLDQIQPDIVILRNLHANYIHLSSLLTYLASKDIGTIVVLHDCWTFTGHCCYYTEDECIKWKTGCHHCPAIKKYNKSLFFDTSAKCFSDKKKLFHAIPRLAVVGVSNWITDEARQSPVFSKAKIIQRIYNWIDLDVFQPRGTNELRQQLSLSETDFVVLGVSQSWSEYKGLYRFEELARQCPDISFVMVGEMSQLTKTTLPSNIYSVGSVNDVNHLAEYYSMADVFLNFSQQETFGKVSAEALACGTPLITNDSTANPELCCEGCGYIFPYGDWQEVPKLFVKMRSEGKNTYTKHCRRSAEERFSLNGGLEEYLRLFNKLISNEV